MSLLLSRKQHFAHAFQYLIGQLLIYHTVPHDIVIIINFTNNVYDLYFLILVCCLVVLLN